ncbi:ARM repeat-containing protein [Mycena indigotica]|uniref:ARM repeat-containing protein n=1 Tax=Mycena indigotica TaxID=2126181 RepID=A0A8H6WFR4_9AGAR|nr:ARM repeat-containing protein [Mycena indigotica]KAF7315031.1 ARM repeat-containing protein [Mycena indigotica]
MYHRDYNFVDGSVKFIAGNSLFKVHRWLFERESQLFRQLFAQRGGSLTAPFVLSDVRSDEFATFLWVFYNPNYSQCHTSTQNWKTILALAHRWGFAEAKSLALCKLKEAGEVKLEDFEQDLPPPNTSFEDVVLFTGSPIDTIHNFSTIPYPANIQRPDARLNSNAKDGKFIYTRDFLLQFRLVCKYKPDDLARDLDAFGLDPTTCPVVPVARRDTRLSSFTIVASGGKRTRSKREKYKLTPQALPPSENVAPLSISANRWDCRAFHQLVPNSPEAVARKVRSWLNKLTKENLDSISGRIIAQMTALEENGRAIVTIQVVRLVFEAAQDDVFRSDLYAGLSRKIIEQSSLNAGVKDDNVDTADADDIQPIASGQLFRKHLLNRCQEYFERGWAAQGPAPGISDFDAFYSAQRAKRQGLGLIKFIGELFKFKMLTERIIHECVKKLLGSVENPEEVESLCTLLVTVGSALDTKKARAHMDVYFARMKEMAKSETLGARLQFMLLDVIELRDRKWVARTSPKLGDDWMNIEGRWSGRTVRPRAPPKAGDLSVFGKLAARR